jgi:hypothetical protein
MLSFFDQEKKGKILEKNCRSRINLTKISVLGGKFLQIFYITQCFFLIKKTPALRSAGGGPHVPDNYPAVLYVEKDREEPHYTGIYCAAFPRWRSWAR